MATALLHAAKFLRIWKSVQSRRQTRHETTLNHLYAVKSRPVTLLCSSEQRLQLLVSPIWLKSAASNLSYLAGQTVFSGKEDTNKATARAWGGVHNPSRLSGEKKHRVHLNKRTGLYSFQRPLALNLQHAGKKRWHVRFSCSATRMFQLRLQ